MAMQIGSLETWALPDCQAASPCGGGLQTQAGRWIWTLKVWRATRKGALGTRFWMVFIGKPKGNKPGGDPNLRMTQITLRSGSVLGASSFVFLFPHGLI